MTTIQQAINQGRQQLVNTVDNPQSEALLLLEHASKHTKEYLIAHNEEPLDIQSYQQYLDYLQRRKLGEPLAYITHIKEFCSLINALSVISRSRQSGGMPDSDIAE